MNRSLAALLACLVLVAALAASCTTVALWGGRLEPGGHVAWDAESPEPFDDLPWLGRLILTPLAVIVDVCTWPLQKVLFDLDDDDDC